jgi:hypothetical protein
MRALFNCRDHAACVCQRQAARRRRRIGGCLTRVFSAKRNERFLKTLIRAKQQGCSRQKSLSRDVVELQPDAIGIFEQQRIIARRPLIFSGRANDPGAKRTQEPVQLIDVGALAGAKTQMVQTDAILFERGTGMFGRGRADPNRGASADAVIGLASVSMTGFMPRNGSSLR